MRNLTPLTASAADVFETCVRGISNSKRRTRIEKLRGKVVGQDALLVTASAAHSLQSLVSPPYSAATKRDLTWFYEQRLVRSSQGRMIYDQILALGRSGCPLCHSGTAQTLDHSFPKSRHPFLAISPLNLVPSCRDCNTSRGVGSGRVSINPYSDGWLEKSRWLYASIPSLASPEDLLFEPRRHPSWSDQQWRLVQEFFTESQIGRRYTDLAISEFTVVQSGIRRVKPAGLVDMRRYLDDRLSDLTQVGLNTWNVAATEAWRAAYWLIRW